MPAGKIMSCIGAFWGLKRHWPSTVPFTPYCDVVKVGLSG